MSAETSFWISFKLVCGNFLWPISVLWITVSFAVMSFQSTV